MKHRHVSVRLKKTEDMHCVYVAPHLLYYYEERERKNDTRIPLIILYSPTANEWLCRGVITD